METEPADLELRLQRDTTCVSGVGENCAAKLPAIAMSLRKFMKEVPATIWQHRNTLIRYLTYGHRLSSQCKDCKVAIARVVQIGKAPDTCLPSNAAAYKPMQKHHPFPAYGQLGQVGIVPHTHTHTHTQIQESC